MQISEIIDGYLAESAKGQDRSINHDKPHMDEADETRLDKSCWDGYKIGKPKTKTIKRDGKTIRVNNCVKEETKESAALGEGGADTSWTNDGDTVTLQDILELTKDIKQINLPIDDKLKSKLLHWDGNPEEIERINQVTVSQQFPILIMVDEQGEIEWILDGNHRLHKAIRSQAKTIPAKLIKPSNLNDKAKRVFDIKEQRIEENTLIVPQRDRTTNARHTSSLEETLHSDEFFEKYGWIEIPSQITEAEYQGRKVTLNKPMQGDVKKFKVYVKNDKGNVVKVNFGDPDMRIRKSNPEARKSFRARHKCDQKKDKTTAGYWSCKKW